MEKKIFIYPYVAGSVSAKDLAAAVGKRIKRKNSKFVPTKDKLVVNWGSTSCPYPCLNSVDAVRLAANKLNTFNTLSEANVRVPEYTTDKDKVHEWDFGNKPPVVYARETLTGNSGDGIVVLENAQQWEDYSHENAKVYTKWVRTENEYRIHVFNGEVIHKQRKARRRDVDDADVNWKVRNHDNGFIFAQGDEALGDVPDDVVNQAKSSVKALGLDFGAVDVIYGKDGLAYVLEVNTACGLTGTTLTRYTEALKGLV